MVKCHVTSNNNFYSCLYYRRNPHRRVLNPVTNLYPSTIVLVLIAVLWVSPMVYGSPYRSDSSSTTDSKYDVIVFAATPAGFAAALAAKASGAERVLLLEPTAHVGGMASPGGIGLRDCDHDEIRRNNGSQHTWAMRNAEFYGLDKPVWQPDNWLGEQTFLEMLKEADVELRLNTTFVEGSAGVRTTVDVSGLRRISGIQLESGEWLECKYVIDASYEGEVMTSSGYVTYTFGRESLQLYNESLGGISKGSIGQFESRIYPYYELGRNSLTKNATLLRWIQDGPDPRNRMGQPDDNLMAYTFRPCLSSDKNNMVPFKEPPGYDPADFELSRRYLNAELSMGKTPRLPWGDLMYHGYPGNESMKYDACCGIASVGIDAAGLAVGYADATRQERKEIYDMHRYYVQGLMWFWANDSTVPHYIQDQIKSKGLCKDEWPENDHFPPQLYVREAARIVGDKVYTQTDRIRSNMVNGCFDDSIAVGSWAFDIHEMQRVAVKDIDGEPMVYNEGLTSYDDGGIYFFEIPYYILLPKRREMVNLAVPNCPSVTHVAFSAIREEPTLWQLGQAAGTAAGIALQHGGEMALQDVKSQELQSSLIEQDAFVHWPPRQNCEDSPQTKGRVPNSKASPNPDTKASSNTMGRNFGTKASLNSNHDTKASPGHNPDPNASPNMGRNLDIEVSPNTVGRSPDPKALPNTVGCNPDTKASPNTVKCNPDPTALPDFVRRHLDPNVSEFF